MHANRKSASVILALSVTVFIYFFISHSLLTDVYAYPIVGAVYELLWIFMWLLLIVIPLVCARIMWDQHIPKWLPILSLVFIGVTVVIIIG
jgi:hypothetical protein